MDQQQLPKTDLSRFNNDWFDEGASKFTWMLWFIANGLFVLNPLNPFNFLRILVLRAFGAKIGKGVIVKHRVNVKFPWNLEIGDHCWIGEAVWIENQGKVTIGSNCCLSQGVVLMTGNHDYKKVTFDLMVKPIVLEDGVWLGARSTVTPGVTCHSHAVLGVGAVTNRDLDSYTVYAGNPCQPIRKRLMETP
ncbi:MAG TPA: WcaF family extracellular polysaccharide biosynthesis acetyltransferase [Bacteroidia bacterium]|jgi:putative colanic acid biosynthesis acetyltransferase WcaF|nr:WcaF family extracellular polysaccharide biosynthesis acetyltransferase [Bacteroidia bacterium]